MASDDQAGYHSRAWLNLPFVGREALHQSDGRGYLALTQCINNSYMKKDIFQLEKQKNMKPLINIVVLLSWETAGVLFIDVQIKDCLEEDSFLQFVRTQMS